MLLCRVFNPHAPSNKSTLLTSCYKKHEREKKRAYEQMIPEIEHATFTPLVLAATGGLANEANVFYKRLASKLASKWDHPYNSTLCWLRCRLAFSLLRSSIQAIRGARSSADTLSKPPPRLTSSPLNVTFTQTSNFSLKLLFVCCFALYISMYCCYYCHKKKKKKKKLNSCLGGYFGQPQTWNVTAT